VPLDDFMAIPLFLPGLGVSIVAAFLLAGAARRTLDAGLLLSWVLIVSLGLILSATVTPSGEANQSGMAGMAACDVSRIGFAGIREVLVFGDTGLNVVLFVPLGAAIGLLPRSREKAVIVVGAIALPFAIETVQLLLPSLHRGCQSADVVDNLTGLAIGLAGGFVAGWLAMRTEDVVDKREHRDTA
jgi:glycopeptide antibiotics resistance protein